MTNISLNFAQTRSDKESLKRLFVASMIGSAIGDALGMPFENLAAAKIRKNVTLPVKSYCNAIEGAPCFQFDLKKGMYTDDTQAIRACARAISKHRALTPAVIADALSGWLFHDSLGQQARYPGVTTRVAMTRYEETRDPHTCGVDSATCGAAIRMLPIALWFCIKKPADLDGDIRQLAKVTHTATCAQDGAVLMARLVQHAVIGGTIAINHLASRCQSKLMKKSLNNVQRALESGTEPDDMAQELGNGTKAHVVVPMAIYHLFRHGFHFEATLSQALNTLHPSGLDTDSIMSIAGGIAGAHYPDEVVSSEWIEDLEDRDLLILEAQQLYDVAAHDGIVVE